MPELSLRNIDQIGTDIRKQEISMPSLLDELIDHVCCDVEYEMQHGLDFSAAYHKVRSKIGSRGLKEIQEETLYAVDTKYRYMKNLMKISGVAGTVLYGFAAMFKIQHWPGAGIMMTLGAMIMIFAFLPSALVVLWKETHSAKRLFMFVSAFLTGTCFIAGTLFKIQHWPYAGAILTIGAITGIFIFIPAVLVNRMNDVETRSKRPAYFLGAAGSMLFVAGLLFKIQHWPLATTIMVIGMILLVMIALPLYTWLTWKEENHISPVFIFLIIGSLLIIMPGALINLNLQHSYQEYYYPNNSGQNELYNYLYRNNNSILSKYHDSLSFKQMDQVHSKTISMLEVITNIQEKMVQESEGEPGKPAVSASQIIQTETGREIVYRQLSYIMDPAPSKDFLFAGCDARKELNSSMADYINFLAGIVPVDDLPKYKKILDTEAYLPVGNSEATKMSLMSGLHSLQIMKNGLLTVESSVLNTIVKHK
jgi:uncharacterized protein with PQ loop repeat